MNKRKRITYLWITEEGHIADYGNKEEMEKVECSYDPQDYYLRYFVVKVGDYLNGWNGHDYCLDIAQCRKMFNML